MFLFQGLTLYRLGCIRRFAEVSIGYEEDSKRGLLPEGEKNPDDVDMKVNFRINLDRYRGD